MRIFPDRAAVKLNQRLDVRKTIPFLFVALLTVSLSLTGCGGNSEPSTSTLRLATTTSTRDSGLLDYLLPEFERENGCRADVIAVGTGAALKLGEAGDADVLLVHARAAEEAFMKAGHGIRHEEIMANYFTILGPEGDPAKIRDTDALDALKQISQGEFRFVSRGDDSGTHKRELALWQQAGIQPAWHDYIESGQGMGPSLIMADEKRAYILCDMGTYLRFQKKVDLIPLTAQSESLRNPYAVIVVDPKKSSKINAPLAQAWVDFLISKNGQQLIGGYRMAGEQLFEPTRLKGD